MAQPGLTVALSTPVTDAALAARDSVRRSKEVKDERLQALYQVKAATELAMAAKQLGAVTDTVNNIVAGEMQGGGNISNPQLKVSVSVGSSQSTSTSQTQQVTHSGSELSAGNINLRTTEGDIDILGSSLNASRIALDSAQHINLESVQDTHANRSDNKNSGWGAGVFVGASGNSYGIGLEASANKGKGHENSDSVTQRNTVLNADNLTLNSQADTNIKGAVVNAQRLDGEVGGDLNIESWQDTNHYASKQTQVSAGASVAIYGSGSSASVNASHSSAKVNYAQVNEQSGLRVGEDGMNLTVGGNTHLKGGLIDSQASADKNHFSTGTLTTENIDNYSDVSVQSISGGLSSDMGNLAMTSMAAAMSALGNVSKDDNSTTQSAVASNINLEIRNGEIPTTLSRDTATANQQVEQFDKAEYQERAEMAQVISQISNNSIVLSLKPKLDEAAQQKAEAEGVLASENSSTEQKAAAQIQLANADKAIEKYGKGGTIQMAVRAVTGVLQGIASGSTESAVVGGVSPYANLAIKQATEGNDTANIMAHAVLGAIEAYATGNNAAAGAVGAASGELAAKIITEQLYGTTADNLTEEQKETVSALSQIAAGLSGSLVGDNTQSAVVSAEIGKRAVENNYLFKHEIERQAELLAKQNTEGLTESEREELTELRQLDNKRDMDLQAACYGGMTTACANELITLSAAFHSYDKPEVELRNGDTRSEYLDVATKYGEAKRQYAEDVAREALIKIAKEGITDSVELATITAKAIAGDDVSQAQLNEMGKAIKALVQSPITTISDSIKSQLAEADRLEANGQAREADVMRMQVYLSTELGVIGGTTGALNLARIGATSAVKLGKLGLSNDIVSNKVVGIDWGKGINNQGKPWEAYLKEKLPEGTLDLNMIKPNFKTFDHLLPDGTAISAKTMDTVGSKTYQNPTRITSQLNKYVDEMVNFKIDQKGEFILENKNIKNKELYLAIPSKTTASQMIAIEKSVQYARSKNIEIIIKKVK